MHSRGGKCEVASKWMEQWKNTSISTRKEVKRCLSKKEQEKMIEKEIEAQKVQLQIVQLMASFVNNCGSTYFSDVPMPIFTNWSDTLPADINTSCHKSIIYIIQSIFTISHHTESQQSPLEALLKDSCTSIYPIF